MAGCCSEVSLVRRSLLLAPFAWAQLARAQPARAQPARTQLAIPPLLLEHAGRLLATLIQAGRDAAIAAGVKPVPAPIERALLGYFPDGILRRIRYVSGQADAIAIPGMAMGYGDIDAIALGDTILFRDDKTAQADAKLWAHELTHIMQYERWGIEGFARRYIEDFAAIEKEARDNADRFARWKQEVRT